MTTPLPVAQCGSCRWWRFKSSVDDGPGVGICDNEANAEQVRVTGTNSVRRALVMLGDWSDERIDEIVGELDTRYREDFGCRHFEGREGDAPTYPPAVIPDNGCPSCKGTRRISQVACGVCGGGFVL